MAECRERETAFFVRADHHQPATGAMANPSKSSTASSPLGENAGGVMPRAGMTEHESNRI